MINCCLTSIESRKSLCSLPASLSIRTSQLSKASYGIWAHEDIPIGTKFGPYDGTIFNNVHQEEKSGYCWQMAKKTNKTEVMDAQDCSQSNWLRYVNCAFDEKQQNLMAYQYGEEIYYICYKPIKRNTELLVWYGKDDFEETVYENGAAEAELNQRDKCCIVLGCNNDTEKCQEKCSTFKSKMNSISQKQKYIIAKTSNDLTTKNSSKFSTEKCSALKKIGSHLAVQRISRSEKRFKNNSIPYEEKHFEHKEVDFDSISHQNKGKFNIIKKPTDCSRLCAEQNSTSKPLKNVDTFLNVQKKIILGSEEKLINDIPRSRLKCFLFKRKAVNSFFHHKKNIVWGTDRKLIETEIRSHKNKHSIFNESNVEFLLQQLKDTVPNTNNESVQIGQRFLKEKYCKASKVDSLQQQKKSIIPITKKGLMNRTSQKRNFCSEHNSKRRERIVCHRSTLSTLSPLPTVSHGIQHTSTRFEFSVDTEDIIQSVLLPNKCWSKSSVINSCNSIVFSECSLWNEEIPLYNKVAYVHWSDTLATSNFTCNLYIRSIKFRCNIRCLKQADELTQLLSNFDKVELCFGACSVRQAGQDVQSSHTVQYYGRVYHRSCNLESSVFNRNMCISCEQLRAVLFNDNLYAV